MLRERKIWHLLCVKKENKEPWKKMSREGADSDIFPSFYVQDKLYSSSIHPIVLLHVRKTQNDRIYPFGFLMGMGRVRMVLTFDSLSTVGFDDSNAESFCLSFFHALHQIITH